MDASLLILTHIWFTEKIKTHVADAHIDTHTHTCGCGYSHKRPVTRPTFGGNSPTPCLDTPLSIFPRSSGHSSTIIIQRHGLLIPLMVKIPHDMVPKQFEFHFPQRHFHFPTVRKDVCVGSQNAWDAAEGFGCTGVVTSSMLKGPGKGGWWMVGWWLVQMVIIMIMLVSD